MKKDTNIINIKEIGRKTRKRLIEEQTKRNEIVRLDYKHVNNEYETIGNCKISNIKKSQNSKKRKAVTRNNIDEWVPDTSNLTSNSITKKDESNVVRLHGLPSSNVKVEDIRTFFVGLSVQSVFFLPNYDEIIPNFDTEDDHTHIHTLNRGHLSTKKKHCFVERQSSFCRIFVKFESFLIATTALKRTGEFLYCSVVSNIDTSLDVNCAIAVTPVSKNVALFLQKNMAIEAIKGEPLDVTISNKNKQIPLPVIQLLWIMTITRLGLDTKITNIIWDETPNDDDMIHNLDFQIFSSTATVLCTLMSSETQGKEHIKIKKSFLTLYNCLWDLHKRLESDDEDFLSIDEYDSTMSNAASTYRLKVIAANWMLEQMEKINKCILAPSISQLI